MRKIDVPLVFSVVAVAAVVGTVIILNNPFGQEISNGGADQSAYQWVGETVLSAAFWTAVFTLALTVSTIGLWRETRRLAKGAELQAEDTKKSLIIAKQAADAAEAAAQTASAANRAWIQLDVKISGALIVSKIGAFISLHVTAKNIGQIPAVQLVYSTILVTDFYAPNFAGEIEMAKLPRGPTARFQSLGSTVFPQQEEHTTALPFIELGEINAQIAKGKTRSSLGVAVIANYSFPGGEGMTIVTYVIDSMEPQFECRIDLTRPITEPKEMNLRPMPFHRRAT